MRIGRGAHLKQSMSLLVPMRPWKLPEGVASAVAVAGVLPASSGSLRAGTEEVAQRFSSPK